MKNQKSTDTSIRTCEVEQYWEFYDVDKIAVVESRVKSLTNIKTYDMIVHDKDVDDNWVLKKPHFHAVLTFSKPTTIGTVANALKVEPQYVQKIKTKTKFARLYLIHFNDQSKYQYKPEEVISNTDYVSFVSQNVPKNKWESVAVLIADWKIKEFQIQDYVGPVDYAKNKCYYDRLFLYRQKKMKTTERALDCIFISGPSGTWKTTLAKIIAVSKNYTVYNASGWKNPLDDYQWQDCILLDDLRDFTFSLSDFLKLTDNNTGSLVWCRFYNKSISECKLIIITSVVPIEDFYKYTTWDWTWEESQVQLFRRIPTLIKMSDEYVRFFEYDRVSNKYIERFHIINPVSIMYNNEIHSSFMQWLKETYKADIITDDHIWETPLFNK